ncbi:2,3-dehydroadipyl-CoA hydratase [Ramlibacter tataouinensis]|uniref:2,3-dehydroadipyl-CoA hydratase n=1 Tax=Ramlibacter tataouinensis TaxID=94132 RepID=A0A140HLE2_9BURK|nr:2,3-dehydroadipyl-CoA hydratase [Ramlibacter tataouinensis]
MAVSLQPGGVVLVELHRPAVRNALRTATLAEIVDVLDIVAADAHLGAVVITGSEKFFAAGADLKEMGALGPIELLADGRPRYWKRIAAFPKPLLAAVSGYALGAGCELAMQADIVIAGEGAQFGQPEINLGIIPGAGGTQRLVRVVGKSRAMQMVLSGEPIDAACALQCGLVSEVVPDEQVVPRTLALARLIAGKAPLALRAAKEALLLSYESALTPALEAERKAFVLLAASQDRNEGIAAFLEKRRPNYEGR